MHVTAFTAVLGGLFENDAITATGLPVVRWSIPQVPYGIQIPVVVSVWAHHGEDHEPLFFIKAHDPDGEMRGHVEQAWHWPDTPGKPFKFKVFTEYVQIEAHTEGFYTFGLYDHPDQTETDLRFPLEIYVSR